ncbi:hypothetical protein Gotur_034028 [Gossypium turneri]
MTPAIVGYWMVGWLKRVVCHQIGSTRLWP